MKTGYIFKHLTGTIFFFLILFLSAGRINYTEGIIYLVISLVMFVLNYTLLKPDPELLEERSKPAEGTRAWDKKILGISFLVTICMYITAGLDSGRYLWSPDFHPVLLYTGIIFTVSGQLLFLIAQKQNRFFSSTVRIQHDRNQAVCNTGLYSFVRHPAYMGSVIQAAGFPLLMGSTWSIIPAGFLVFLTVVRTYMEDNTLKNELKSYIEYSEKVKYRFIPFFW